MLPVFSALFERLVNCLHTKLWNYREERQIQRMRRHINHMLPPGREMPDILLRGESWKLQKMIDAPGARFSMTDDGILYTLNGKSMLLTDWNDIFIATDSFVDFDYAFSLPQTKPVYVFDIGANVGDTALVFAVNPLVAKVFSFEPLPSIYQRMLTNISYNSASKDKIVPYDFGLGNKDALVSVAYPVAGAYCATGTEHWHESTSKSIHEEMVIRDVATVLPPILQDIFSDACLVLKMDCEGAEFALLPHMAKHGLLSRFSLVLMEFHRTDPAPLVSTLQQAGFVTFWSSSLVGLTGRLYAYRSQVC